MMPDWLRRKGATLWLLVGLVCGLMPGTANAVSGEVLCAQLAERNYFVPAADCYQKEADKIPYRAAMKEEDRLRKGGFLREVGRNLDRAAAAEKRPEVAAALREKAIFALQTILKLGLVRRKAGKRRGRLIQVMLGKIRANVGYTPLAISTASKTAQIEVKGYQFQATATQKLNQSLRPGPYTVRVKYANEAAWRTRKIVLVAGKPSVLTFVAQAPVPALAWVGYTLGISAIVAGGVMLVYGAAKLGEYQGCVSNPNCIFTRANAIFVKAPEAERQPIICQRNDPRETCKAARQCVNSKIGICIPATILTGAETSALQEPGIIFTAVGASTLAVGATLLAVAIVAHKRSQSQDGAPQAKAAATGAFHRLPKDKRGPATVLLSTSLP